MFHKVLLLFFFPRDHSLASFLDNFYQRSFSSIRKILNYLDILLWLTFQLQPWIFIHFPVPLPHSSLPLKTCHSRSMVHILNYYFNHKHTLLMTSYPSETSMSMSITFSKLHEMIYSILSEIKIDKHFCYFIKNIIRRTIHC